MSYNYNIEKSVVDTGLPTTYRSLDPDSPLNQHLTEAERLAAKAAMEKLLKEVQIRFDNDPKYLTKRDFGKLIELLGGAFDWLYSDPQIKDPDTDAIVNIITSWDELMPDPDSKIPSAGLVYEHLMELLEKITILENTPPEVTPFVSTCPPLTKAVVNGDTLILSGYGEDVRTLTLKLHSVMNLEKKPKILIFK